jgi:predicted 2-oxoglutarate/Fe(II)-dependent dioxygenase YbiX
MYKKIMEVTIGLCNERFGPITEMTKNKKIFPEFEYIVYESDGAFIEPHVDNHSIMTGILMMSRFGTDFEGGMNCFKGQSAESGEYRSYQLEPGDCVLFRGEKLDHWITPVTRGVRKILQWELSRI